MSSQSDAAVTDETTNIAVDRRAVQESGIQVVDSIVYDSAPEAIQDVMVAFEASWAAMVENQTFNFQELTTMGLQVLDFAQRSQIEMSQTAETMLEQSLSVLDAQMRNGNLVVGLASDTVEQSFEFSTDALDVVANVKTGDFASISYAVLAFAAFAIFISRK